MRQYLRIGKIISLHGIKGEVKVFPTTDDVKRFDSLKEFYITNSEDANDSEFSNASVYESEGTKYIKNTCILKVKGFESIEDSTKLVSKNIYVKRSNAIGLKDNEYFVVDLIGTRAYLGNKLLGSVKDIMKTKANGILIIDYDGKDLLVPLVEDFIESVDINNSIIRIKTIEGLI